MAVFDRLLAFVFANEYAALAVLNAGATCGATLLAESKAALATENAAFVLSKAALAVLNDILTIEILFCKIAMLAAALPPRIIAISYASFAF